MKKDAYYFPHFSNARNDAKLVRLRRILGAEGYGIYFMLLEILREQTDFKYKLIGIEDLEYEWHISKEKIATVINDFGLFEFDNENFYSTKLISYLQPYLEKSERARQAAIKRWDNAKAYAKAYANVYTNADARALHLQCTSNANQNASKGKESKVNKSKGKEEYPPLPFPPPNSYNFSKEVLSYINQFIQHKEKINKPFTNSSLLKFYEEVKGLNPDLIAKSLNEAIKKGSGKAFFDAVVEKPLDKPKYKNVSNRDRIIADLKKQRGL